MRIVFDHDIMIDGRVVGRHFIDTTDPAVIATFTALSGNAAAQAQAGYAVAHNVAGRPPGETRWQHILFRLQAAPPGDPLKALGLV